MAKIEIYGETFPTKKAAEERIKAIRDAATVGQPIPPEDLAFMLDVLERHPNADEKIGVGVASMRIEKIPPWFKNKGFVLTRVDGTETEFSYLHCLTPRSPLQDLKAALRAEVADQVIAFRDEVFALSLDEHITCPVTGQRITVRESHVDHWPPQTFDQIARDFITARDLDPARVEILGYGDGETVKRLANRELADDWQRCHEEVARLRVVSIRANLSDIKRGAH
jgi:hypothetical protein